MSELRADTITASDGTSPVTLTKQSAAKAWCDWNNTGTPSINESLNVASLTDISTGRTGLNFTNSMNSAYYAVSGSGSNGYAMMSDVGTVNTTSAVNVQCWYSTYFDSAIPKALVIGDLA